MDEPLPLAKMNLGAGDEAVYKRSSSASGNTLYNTIKNLVTDIQFGLGNTRLLRRLAHRIHTNHFRHFVLLGREKEWQIN
jgi:hypothetical protein